MQKSWRLRREEEADEPGTSTDGVTLGVYDTPAPEPRPRPVDDGNYKGKGKGKGKKTLRPREVNMEHASIGKVTLWLQQY